MMRSGSTAFALVVLSVALLTPAVIADTMTLAEMAEDIIPVELQLNVNYQLHHRYQAGDPPTTARGSTSISFRRSGVYTFIRFKEGLGMRYAAVPGRIDEPQFAPVEGISVYQTHACHDNEGSIIGRRGHDLSGSATVHPASGDIMLSDAEGDGDRVRIAIGSWRVETEHVPCPTQPYCFDERTFHFDGEVGEDSEAWVEMEGGALQYEGIVLAAVEWSLLRSLADGGELPLVIPISVAHTEQTGGEGPDTDTFVEVYSVTGVIAPVDELPLVPLVPRPPGG